MTVWKGVFPAVTTKMTKDAKVDLEATQTSISRLVENGVSGVVVLSKSAGRRPLVSVSRPTNSFGIEVASGAGGSAGGSNAAGLSPRAVKTASGHGVLSPAAVGARSSDAA